MARGEGRLDRLDARIGVGVALGLERDLVDRLTGEGCVQELGLGLGVEALTHGRTSPIGKRAAISASVVALRAPDTTSR